MRKTRAPAAHTVSSSLLFSSSSHTAAELRVAQREYLLKHTDTGSEQQRVMRNCLLMKWSGSRFAVRRKIDER